MQLTQEQKTAFLREHRTRVVGPDFLRRHNLRAYDRRQRRNGESFGRCTTGRRFLVLDVWSRDCDMCESSYLSAIPATLGAYEAYCDDMARNAEGPWHAVVMDPRAIEGFEPETRDRALEAWENGYGANAYCV